MKGWLAIGICMLAAIDAAGQGVPQAASGSPPAMVPAPPANIHSAVVRIVAPSQGSVSYGSGTLIYTNDAFGLVITNWHVINEATAPISVHFPDGFYSLGNVQKVDRDWDLALIAIRKPNVQPVNLAAEAPRPGELLTIAGYGAGTYRAASGRCTQYVAPGTTFPFEMVEVSVSARQGDSGGPIFNARGELAGVLFGEGQGRTSGSYCGRVRWFLTSVIPATSSPQPIVAQSAPQLERVAPRPVALAAKADPFRPASAPIVQTSPQRDNVTSTIASPGVVASTRGEGLPDPAVRTLGWEDLAGATLGEQAKTVLAIVGVVALLLHALRWLGSQHAPA